MTYTRQTPSDRYRELLRQYQLLHAEGERKLGLTAAETYPGISLIPHAATIRELVAKTGSCSILDYGAGKGIAYDLSPIEIPGHGPAETLIDYWNVDAVHCFDPCYPPYSALPDARFDAVVCTDVLEHCPEEDMSWIVGELFSFARNFVFASIACFPALTHLPNGENAHLTIREPSWWQDLFATAARAQGNVGWHIVAETYHRDGGREEVREHRFGTL